MHSAALRRRAIAVPGAIMLSLILASQAMAATWTPKMPLTSSGIAFAEGIVAVGPTSALALYIEHEDLPGPFRYSVFVRRTTDAGASFGPPMRLSKNGLNADIAARDGIVDVVWDNINSDRIRYRRSMDGGVTFGPTRSLSPVNKSATNPTVARGPAGVVAVAWENRNTGVLWSRVSTDGGDTFGPMTKVANVFEDLGSEIAVGNGVIYIGYTEDNGLFTLSVRRSTNDGATWSLPTTVSDDAYAVFESFDITAAGRRAYIAYTVETDASREDVKYRRTTNRGASWSAEAPLAPKKWRTWEPAISLQGGVVRAVFTRRHSGKVSVYYRQSSDGVNWSRGEQVAGNSYESGITFAGESIAHFRSGVDFDAFISTRMP